MTQTADPKQPALSHGKPSTDGPLTATDLYWLAGTVLVTGGHVDGTVDRPEVRNPEDFRYTAERLRGALQIMGVEVESGEIPLLHHDPDGVPGKYVVVS